jgi:hypothetical protein
LWWSDDVDRTIDIGCGATSGTIEDPDGDDKVDEEEDAKVVVGTTMLVMAKDLVGPKLGVDCPEVLAEVWVDAKESRDDGRVRCGNARPNWVRRSLMVFL